MKLKEIEYGETITHNFENMKFLLRATVEEGDSEERITDLLKNKIKEEQKKWLNKKTSAMDELLEDIREKRAELLELKDKIAQAYRLLGDNHD